MFAHERPQKLLIFIAVRAREENNTRYGTVWFYCFIIYVYRSIFLFADGPGDRGLIQGRVIPKTQKMELDISLLNSQHYKVHIEGKVEQSKEKG